MKIAMWSGPRNLSTAMMYSFGNRADCAATDEPFYAAYLTASGVTHPMNDQIISSQPNDPNDVISAITGSNPDGVAHWYQKHMTHHMLPNFPMDWISDFTNVFLIRHPARVIASYAAKRENPSLEDLGFVQQKRIYDHCLALGQTPIVVDSDDILADPETVLTGLCDQIGIPFDPAMLAWSAGSRTYDGVWAAHWYDSVHQSTGFGPAPKGLPPSQAGVAQLQESALEIYRSMGGRVDV